MKRVWKLLKMDVSRVCLVFGVAVFAISLLGLLVSTLQNGPERPYWLGAAWLAFVWWALFLSEYQYERRKSGEAVSRGAECIGIVATVVGFSFMTFNTFGPESTIPFAAVAVWVIAAVMVLGKAVKAIRKADGRNLAIAALVILWVPLLAGLAFPALSHLIHGRW